MVDASSSQPGNALFALPAPAVARHPQVLLTPREVRKWLDSLPLGNPPKAAGLLLHQLQLLVRDPQPGSRLASLLDLYLDNVARLLEVAHHRMRNEPESAQPLDQLDLQLLEAVTALAHGYLRVVNDRLATGKAPELVHLVRALAMLDESLALAVVHYHRPPASNWQLLLQIYRLAAGRELTRAPPDPKRPFTPVADTVHGLFFRALILALCDPHQHRPGDYLAWRDWVGGHTGDLELTLLPQGGASIPVDLSGALPPLTAARCARPGPDVRYLAADAFLAELRQADDAPASLLLALERLLRGRRTPEQRRASRQPRDHPFVLLHGLRDVHARLLALTGGAAQGMPPADGEAARQLDQSQFGSSFRLQGPLRLPLTIGELVLAEAEVHRPGAPPVGFAARIRRVVVSDDRQVEIGVEKLRGRLTPVTLSGQAAERVRGATDALLQHDLDEDRLTLIGPRAIFREGDTVSVEGPGVRYNLRLRRLEDTALRTGFIAAEVV